MASYKIKHNDFEHEIEEDEKNDCLYCGTKTSEGYQLSTGFIVDIPICQSCDRRNFPQKKAVVNIMFEQIRNYIVENNSEYTPRDVIGTTRRDWMFWLGATILLMVLSMIFDGR